MSHALSDVHHGLGSVRPYLNGPAGLPEFVRKVFGATELESHEFGPESFHVELKLADSVLVIEAGALTPATEPWKGTVEIELMPIRSLAK